MGGPNLSQNLGIQNFRPNFLFWTHGNIDHAGVCIQENNPQHSIHLVVESSS